MKWDTEIVDGKRGESVTTQSNASDSTTVALQSSAGEHGWVILERAQVVELIGNLVALLADLDD